MANILLMNEAAHLSLALVIDLPFLTSVMEASSGRNSSTRDYGAYRDLHLANSLDPDVTRRLQAILRKDLKLASTLAQAADIPTPILHAVSKATDALTEEDLSARWRTVARGMVERDGSER